VGDVREWTRMGRDSDCGGGWRENGEIDGGWKGSGKNKHMQERKPARLPASQTIRNPPAALPRWLEKNDRTLGKEASSTSHQIGHKTRQTRVLVHDVDSRPCRARACVSSVAVGESVKLICSEEKYPMMRGGNICIAFQIFSALNRLLSRSVYSSRPARCV